MCGLPASDQLSLLLELLLEPESLLPLLLQLESLLLLLLQPESLEALLPESPLSLLAAEGEALE